MEYSQNATLVFISAYSAYVFCGKRTIPLSTRLYQQRYLIWLRGKDSNLFAQTRCVCLHSCGARFRLRRSRRLALTDRYATIALPFSATGGGRAPCSGNPPVGGSMNSTMKKKQGIRKDALLLFGCGGRIRTSDLRVMSPTSCPCSTPRCMLRLECFYYSKLRAGLQPLLQKKITPFCDGWLLFSPITHKYRHPCGIFGNLTSVPVCAILVKNSHKEDVWIRSQ